MGMPGLSSPSFPEQGELYGFGFTLLMVKVESGGGNFFLQSQDQYGRGRDQYSSGGLAKFFLSLI